MAFDWRNPFGIFGGSRTINAAVIIGKEAAEAANLPPSSGLDVLALPASIRAVSILSEALGTARIEIRRGGVAVPGHPLAELLNGLTMGIASPWLRAWAWNRAICYGDSYLLVKRTSSGEPYGFVPLDPQSVDIALDDVRGLYYIVGNQATASENIVHFKGAIDPLNPWQGWSPLRNPDAMLRAAATHAKALEATALTGFVGKTKLESPNAHEPEQVKKMREKYAVQHGDFSKYQEPALLGEQIKGGPLREAAPTDALSAGAVFVREIARATGVPAALLGEGEGRSTAETVAQLIEFGLRPRSRVLDAELTEKLCAPGESIHHLVDDLRSADFLAAGRVFAPLRQLGVLSPNDIRSRMGIAAVPGGDALEVLMPGANPTGADAGANADNGANGGNDAGA